MQFIVTIDDVKGKHVKAKDVLQFVRWTVAHRGTVFVVHKAVNVTLSDTIANENIIRIFTTLNDLNSNWNLLAGK